VVNRSGRRAGRRPPAALGRRDVGDDHSTHGDDRPGADRHVIAHHGSHPDEDVFAHADVSGDVRARPKRRKGADFGVMPDERATADDHALTYLRTGADHDARPDDRTGAQRGSGRHVCPRMNERRCLPAPRTEAFHDRPPIRIAGPEKGGARGRLLEPAHWIAVNAGPDPPTLVRLEQPGDLESRLFGEASDLR
jgi:hypothetical protein